jgi:hypothetical protein
VLKHLLPVSREMFGVEHGQFDIVLPEKIEQQLLALYLRELSEVPIPPEERSKA